MTKIVFKVCFTMIGLVALASSASAEVKFSWTTVGDAGNTADSTGFGAVGYEYSISQFEVTNDQYAEFLNVKAASDPFALYSANMAIGHGGISRSGSSGSYTYDVLPLRLGRPVVFVTEPDAQRFVNWLHNGQGAGDTETGVYDMSGVGFVTPPNGNGAERGVGASSYVLTSRDEWYKAAYYQPFADGGDVDDYWDYANGSNISPTQTEAIYGASNAFARPVGSGGVQSYYGTYDQNGNVWETTDTQTNPNPVARVSTLGNAWSDASLGTPTAGLWEIKPNPLIGDPTNIGFRVANLTVQPEPNVPAGFVDASLFGGGYNPVDARIALQTALDTGLDVYVPNMGTDWTVGDTIFMNKDNQTILFEDGVVLAAKQGEFIPTGSSLFAVIGATNVRIEGYGATFRMRKSDYQQAPYPVSESRMGIAVVSTTDIEILGLTIEDTGGDGIYIGGATGGTGLVQNALIKDVVIDNVFRNGISLINAKDLVIDNVVIANTNGTPPEAGIDLEPNFSNEILENIEIRNSIIVASNGDGIAWFVSDRPGISGIVENVTIVSNGDDGLVMLQGALSNWTIKDSLIVDNSGDGFSVSSGSHGIEFSAFSGNGGGALGGGAFAGTGTILGVAPTFVSTDINDPQFMYLDPSTSALITAGASDGGFMGARPVAVVPGDFDSDGDVDGADFLLWQRGGSPNPLSQSDLSDWEGNYGTGGGALAVSASAVPEPATSLLMLLGIVFGSLLPRGRNCKS